MLGTAFVTVEFVGGPLDGMVERAPEFTLFKVGCELTLRGCVYVVCSDGKARLKGLER